MGRDEDSLTEQQRKPTVTTILIRIYKKKKRMYRAALSHHPMPSVLPSRDSPPHGQLTHSEPSMTSHSTEYPVCLASLSQLALLFPLLASCEN